MMQKAWPGSENRKFYFQGINSWEQKLKIRIDVAWEYVKKWQHVWYNMLTFCSQVAKLSDRPLYVPYLGGGRGQWLGGHHGECGARAYNGGPGAEPPAGSRGRVPGQGGEAPWSWKHFGHWMSNGASKFSPFPKMSFRTSATSST